MAQIAADTLGLDLGDIRVHLGSTTLLAEGFGSFHSRATVMGGSAVLIASRELKRQIARVVAQHCHCAEAEVVIGPKLAVSAGAIPLDRVQLGRLGIQATAEFASDRRTYGFGAAAAHVTVDPRTGAVAVVDYFAVQDIGRIINSATAHGQVVGAIVQGLGGALLEELVYDKEGQLLTGTLADYLMPTAADFPNVRALLLEDAPSPSNPLGAKGVGEGGTIPVAGVVSNAVAAALATLKVEPKSLPLSPMYVWELIQAASREATTA
jgi:carbon-monoxide dehydrogenase large subunit